jgi:voltage-gated potassium channel
MTDTNYDLLEGHVVILGFGDLTEPLIEELGEREFVVVTTDTDAVTWCRNHDVNVIVGDPSEEGPLRDAGITHASAVVAATENDAEDAFAILTARELNPDARIVAAATARRNLKKLRRAGADTVLSPAMIGGQLLGQSAVGEHNVSNITDKFE